MAGKENITALDYLHAGKPVPEELIEEAQTHARPVTDSGMDSWYKTTKSPFGFHGGEFTSPERSGFH